MPDTKISDLNALTNAGVASADLFVMVDTDGTETKKLPVSELDLRYAGISHNHAAGDITSGTLADARVAETNVTQHQAALAITESQISDLGSYLTDITGQNLSALADVTITAIASGELLVWNGSAWINNTLAEAGIAAASHTHTESDISDLGAYIEDITAESFGDLSDVTITSIASGELIAWNGAAWINRTLAEAGVAAASHTHATSDITSGTFADARIAETNVTQHQAALAITESQISDLGSYLTDITGQNLSALADVTITTIASGEILRWNGAAWINNTLAEAGIAAASHTHTESDITDLGSYLENISEDTTPQLGGNLDVNGSSIVSASDGDIAITPNGTGDLILDGLKWPQADGTNGQVLKTNGTGQLSWQDDNASGSSSLDGLTDVVITTVTDNEVLVYDNGSGDWINATLAEAGISATGHTHTEYVALAGRSGGQDIIGGTSNQENLTLESTSHVDKGIIQSKDPHQFDASAYFSEIDNGNSSTADTISWEDGNKQKSTLTDNCTFTFNAPPGPCNLILRLIQDATGSRTVTWPASVKWPGGTAPTLTTAANAIDIVSFYFDGTNYYGQAGLDFS